jgi:hypothetical protein
MMSDDNDATLDQLFPNLAPYLRDNVNAVTNIPDTGERSTVTMEDVDRYMQGKLTPMFRSGQGAPPPKAGWDGPTNDPANETPGRVVAETNPPQPAPDPDAPTPDTGDRQVPSSPPGAGNDSTSTPTPTPAEMPQPFQEPGTDSQQTPPNETTNVTNETTVPTAQPQDGEQFVQLGDITIPRSRLEAYLALDQELARSPELRETLRQHFERQVGVSPPTNLPQPAAQQPQPSPIPDDPFSSIPEEYRDDPVVQVAQRAFQAQQAEIARLNAIFAAQQQEVAQQRMIEFNKAVETGTMNFQRAHSLTDEDMVRLRTQAAQLNVVDNLLPQLGPVGAVERALETAYFMDPSFREKELARVAAEQRNDSAKKQKLAAISGSSGSVPRTTPAPTTEEGRRAAMIADVGAMMNGTWTGDNG